MSGRSERSGDGPAKPLFVDTPAASRRLDAPSVMAFRTPLQEHAPAADTKAGAILTAIGLMFTLLAKYGATFTAILQGDNHEKWLLLALTAGYSGLALTTIVHAFHTISPRSPPAPESLAFFGDIARMSREEYLRRVEATTQEEAVEHILNYNYTLSRICVAKFAVLRKAVRMFKLAFLVWAMLVLLINGKVLF